MTVAITVIVPVYKVEKYIDKCLTSLHKQTFDDFEVWAVNDGSPDNSKEILQKWSRKDSKIKYIEKSNGGYGSVLQYCIDNIKSKYFLICDPDDWLAPNALEVLYTRAEQNKLDLLVGDKYNVYIEDNKEEYVSSKPKNIDIVANTIYTDKDKIEEFSFLLVSPHAKLYKTCVAKGITFPTHVSFTDFELYVLALLKVTRCEYISKPLAYYLINRPGNTVMDKSKKVINDSIKVWQSTYNQLVETPEKSVLLWRMYVQLQIILVSYSKISKTPFKDGYENRIYALLIELSKYRRQILQVGPKKLGFKLILNGLLNVHTFKIFSKLYTNMKK